MALPFQHHYQKKRKDKGGRRREETGVQNLFYPKAGVLH